jgi:hypothetical protein
MYREENWNTKRIQKLKFYTIKNDDDLKAILNQISYNLKDFYFFKWKLDNWSYDYRLAYDVEFR